VVIKHIFLRASFPNVCNVLILWQKQLWKRACNIWLKSSHVCDQYVLKLVPNDSVRDKPYQRPHFTVVLCSKCNDFKLFKLFVKKFNKIANEWWTKNKYTKAYLCNFWNESIADDFFLNHSLYVLLTSNWSVWWSFSTVILWDSAVSLKLKQYF